MSEPTAKEEWLTISAAAEELGMSRLTVSTTAIAGELVADSRAGMTFISKKSIEAYKAKQKKKASKK